MNRERLTPVGGTAAAMVVIVLALGATVTNARGSGLGSAGCTPKFVSGALHLCGPATGQLSVFGSYTFRNGTCKRTVVAGEPNFVLELGALKPGSATNGGLSYLKIEIDGPFSNPTSGSLISWHDGKRWAGYGESFRGNARDGTFVVTGSAKGAAIGGRRATGSFHC